MMKRILISFLLLLSSLGLSACSQGPKFTASYSPLTAKVKPAKLAKFSRQAKFTSPVTLVFHGMLSSAKSERAFSQAALATNSTNSVTQAQVSPSGHVSLIGNIPSNARNPIVEVNFANNAQINFAANGVYASNVVKKLKEKYGIKEVYMVGHSLGNFALLYYKLQNQGQRQMPTLTKQVDLAGDFDGLAFSQLPEPYRQPKGLKLDLNGKPNKMNTSYRALLKVRKLYQKRPVQVLNIIGDTGHQSDGLVKNASSLSLQYLVANSPYRVLTVKGADHGQLTYNRTALLEMIRFLYYQ